MTRQNLFRVLAIVVVGLVLVAVTYVGFSLWYNGTAPTEQQFLDAKNQAEVLAITQRSDQAGTIRTGFLIAAGIEIVGTLGFAAYRWSEG